MMRSIFVKQGIPGLYAGVSAPLLAVTPASAITFSAYEYAKNTQLQGSNRKELSMKQTAVAGGFSGIWLALVVGPLERFKCLMQVNKSKYNGFNDCVRQVYKEGGIRSVFRGTGLTVLRDVPGNAAYFAGYEFTRRTMMELERRSSPSVGATLLAGGMAGVANWIVAIPFDTMKSRWQTAPPGTYKNLLEAFRLLLEKEGPTGLFKGLSPALLRAFPANAACLLGVETARSCLAFLDV